MTTTWLAEFDWDGDGTFEVDDAGRLVGLSTERGRKRLVRRDGKGFERIRPGRGVLTLDNYDGRYDPLNTSSPLYPNVLPGKEVKVRCIDSNGTTHGIIRGRIDNIYPSGDKRRGNVTIELSDGWKPLYNRQVFHSVVASTSPDIAVGLVLDAADWPAAWGRSLGVAADTIDYWWANGETAADALHDLAESEQGQFWIDGDGQANFRGRHAIYNAAAVATIQASQALRSVMLPQPWEAVRNIITVGVFSPVLAATAVLFSLQEVPELKAGESYTIFGDYKSGALNVPAINIVTPVVTTDYTGNTAAGGGGTDISADLSVAITDFGTRVKIVVTNNGTLNGYITKLQVRGDAITQGDELQIEAQSAASQVLYGPLSFEVNLRWQQDSLVATDLANYLKNNLSSPQAFPAVPIEGRDTLQFGLELFDVVTMQFSTLGINADYFIAGIEHDWLFETGQGVRTVLRCEPKDTTDYWIFTTKIGQTSRFAY